MALIVPCLLAADLAHLGGDLEMIQEAGVKRVHIDVCDGHFAPGITVGLPVSPACERRRAWNWTFTFWLSVRNVLYWILLKRERIRLRLIRNPLPISIVSCG